MSFGWLLVVGATLEVATGTIVPPLFDYDNLTQCREHYFSEAVFCYVKVITKADDPFRSIHDHKGTRLVQQFRRNLLEHAICVQDCEQEVVRLSYEEQKRLYYDEFPIEFRHMYNTLHWDDELQPYLQNYSKLINICVNNRLERRYNLTYHGYSKSKSTSDIYLDFAYIDGLRVVINFFILYGHCMMVPLNLPVENPEDAEACTIEVGSRYGTAIFAFAVQIFFTISGLLLMVNFLRDVHRHPKLEPGYFRTKIINRLIRLLPVYYFFLLVATVEAILPGVELGPLGYQVLVREQHICRNNWWINVLMINNLPFYDTQCMMHAWYLGADLQLFLLGVLILWMIWKFPDSVKGLFWALVMISIAVPVGILYHFGLESVMTSRHSESPFLFMYDPWLREIYQPSYNNINSLVGGMIAGYLYHLSRHGKLNLDDSWFYYLMWGFSIPAFILSVLPINLFFVFDIPRWSILLHFVLFRNMIVAMVCLGYIKCFRSPKGWIRRLLSTRIMTTMGKLCYSSYVIHVLVIRYLINLSPKMLHFSNEEVTTLTATTVGLSYLVSVPVYLCIEQPVGSVLKAWLIRSKSGKPV
ncbi:regulator of hypoxia-inducible factor 1 [Culex quinquefasciatus]|uniref:regulator of hypoxia-inducible factor 1 n=1 Tax=Culex quinquefasciatus TaxID=7176 RepID=UPI0018E3B7C9|nr:regulator of hypoxia-inducible factor 1 [Culex quinquefasciatus]